MPSIDATLPSGLGDLTLVLYSPSTLAAEAGVDASEGTMPGHYRWTSTSAAGDWLASITLSDGTLISSGAVRIGSGAGPYYLTDPASLFDDSVEAETIASEVWSHASRTLTQTASAIAAALEGDLVSIHRGDSFTATFSGLGDLSDAAELWWTVKSYRTDLDSASLVQVTATGGLLYLDGEAADDSSLGSLTYHLTDGTCTISLDEAATAVLSPAKRLCYDLQVLRTSGAVTTLVDGAAQVVADVTRAYSAS